MKPNIHPEYKKLVIKVGSDVFETNSTLPAGEILMDVDYRKHPAWTKESSSAVNQSNQTVSKFKDKFGGFGLDFGMQK